MAHLDWQVTTGMTKRLIILFFAVFCRSLQGSHGAVPISGLEIAHFHGGLEEHALPGRYGCWLEYGGKNDEEVSPVMHIIFSLRIREWLALYCCSCSLFCCQKKLVLVKWHWLTVSLIDWLIHGWLIDWFGWSLCFYHVCPNAFLFVMVSKVREAKRTAAPVWLIRLWPGGYAHVLSSRQAGCCAECDSGSGG